MPARKTAMAASRSTRSRAPAPTYERRLLEARAERAWRTNTTTMSNLSRTRAITSRTWPSRLGNSKFSWRLEPGFREKGFDDPAGNTAIVDALIDRFTR